MTRLRSKLTFSFLSIAVATVLGMAVLTSRSFVQDKRRYVNELNAIAAPNIAFALGKQIKGLEDQLAILEDLFARPGSAKLQTEVTRSVFTNLPGVFQIDIYRGEALYRTISRTAPESGTQAQHSPLGALLREAPRAILSLSSPTDPEKRSVLFVANGKLLRFSVWLEPRFFQESLDLAPSLRVVVLGSDGSVVATNTALPDLPHASQVAAQLGASGPLAGTVAMELNDLRGEKVLATLSPVPLMNELRVLVYAPSEQVSILLGSVLTNTFSFTILILALSVIVAIVLAAQIARPLEELTRATSRIAEGTWEILIESRPKNEIGRLILAFSQMAKRLERREQALKKANEELVRTERLAVLGKFSAGIAHEVKNPLSSILGYAQLLQRKLPMPEARAADAVPAKYITFIIEETRRAAKIISDLLMFARQKPPVLTEVAVAEVLRHAREMLEPQASAAGVTFQVQDADAEWRVSIDRDQIFQVLLNLVTNAIHATEAQPEGKEKRIELQAERSVQDDTAMIVLSVRDTGAGIKPEDLPRIFEPFFSTKDLGKGSGLGLSLCHGIVSLHGGRIEVQSNYGAGTTFRIFVPQTAPGPRGNEAYD